MFTGDVLFTTTPSIARCDFNSSQYDAAMSSPGRQPGSSFKVFTLVTALEQGHSPDDPVDGSTPCVIPNPGGRPDPWTPSNFEDEAFGEMSLTDATVHSVNCAYARLALQVGADHIIDTAHQMGVTAPLPKVPSVTLGTASVPPLQMASAYATLAADGVYHRPHLVQEVDGPDGRVVFKADTPPRRVMSEQIARETTAILQQVVIRGTGRNAAVSGRPIAGKTGTAENYQDAWFVGFTPQLATTVWMGDRTAELPMRGVGGIDVVGGSYPAQMWSAFMTPALAPLPVVDFPAPDPTQMPPGAPPPAGPATGGTTWCWSSCGKGAGGPPPPHGKKQ